MRGFLFLVGVIAALCIVGALLNAAGSDSGIVSSISTGHAIESAILMAVCFVGAGVLGELKDIVATLGDLAGKPRALKPPPPGKKYATPDAPFSEAPPNSGHSDPQKEL